MKWLSPVELEEDGWYVLTFDVKASNSDRLVKKLAKAFDIDPLKVPVSERSAFVDIAIEKVYYDNGHWRTERSGEMPLKGTERLFGPIPMERKIGP